MSFQESQPSITQDIYIYQVMGHLWRKLQHFGGIIIPALTHICLLAGQGFL